MGGKKSKTLDVDTIEWSSGSEWIIEAKQERSRITTEKILDAGYTLFQNQGYEGTTIIDIAEMANIATGSIYRRFTDKDAILWVIIDSYYASRLRDFDRMIEEVFKGVRDPEEFFLLYARLNFSAYRKDRRFVRLLERRSLVDPAVRKIVTDTLYHGAAKFREVLCRIYPSVSPEKLYRSIFQCHNLMHSVLTMSLLADDHLPPGPLIVDDPSFEDQMRSMLQIWFSTSLSG